MAGKRSWVYVNGQAYEVGVDEIPENPLEGTSQLGAGALWGDRHYDGMRATDGSDISTRAKHRAYMKQHGLTTVDDFTNHFEKKAKERADTLTTGGDHKRRREAVERAVYEHFNRRK